MVRFMRAVQKQDDHWIWTQATTGSKSTYGVFYAAGSKQVYAHRWIYEQKVGSIPPGYEVDHTCRIPLCVNPDHLEAVTSAENERRTRLDVCRSGRHDLTVPGNQRWDPQGRRRGCRPCKLESERNYAAAQAARKRNG